MNLSGLNAQEACDLKHCELPLSDDGKKMMLNERNLSMCCSIHPGFERDAEDETS